MSENYACVDCNFSMPPLETRMFSFNSPWGACDDCNGLGIKKKVSEDLLIPDKSKSILEGAIVTFNLESNIESDSNNLKGDNKEYYERWR